MEGSPDPKDPSAMKRGGRRPTTVIADRRATENEARERACFGSLDWAGENVEFSAAD